MLKSAPSSLGTGAICVLGAVLFGLALKKPKSQSTPVWDDNKPFRVVLLGGGHSNSQVLKTLLRKDVPSHIQLTLVSHGRYAYYSGMIPACVAGLYQPEQAAIDLQGLCEWAGWTFINARATGIDRKDKRIICEGRESVPYDILSIDIGSTTRDSSLPGVSQHTVSTRPIGELCSKLDAAQTRFKTQELKTLKVVVVGGGAAGVEMAMGIQQRLKLLHPEITLVDHGQVLLSGSSPAMQKAVATEFKSRGIVTVLGVEAKAIEQDCVKLSNGTSLPSNLTIWATGAAPHEFKSDLQMDKRGFICVNDTLQTVTDPQIFASGDCCSMVEQRSGFPPKAGVYAVREGPVLVDNITALLKGKPVRKYIPQKDFLSLLCCGDGRAIGGKWSSTFTGKWVWKLKDWIDTEWMKLFDAKRLLASGTVELLPMVIDGQQELVAKLNVEQAAAALSRGDKEETKETKTESKQLSLDISAPTQTDQAKCDHDAFLAQWVALVKMNDEQDFRQNVLQACANQSTSTV